MSVKAISAVLLLFLGTSLAAHPTAPTDPADLVDPHIGLNEQRGQTVIGPTLPHGSVHPSPDTPGGATSGYKVGAPVRGFSQLHVSGTGWTTYGNILLSPQIGLNVSESGHDSPIADEAASAYSYKAILTRYGIAAELVWIGVQQGPR